MKYLSKESFSVPTNTKAMTDMAYDIAVGNVCSKCEHKKCNCKKVKRAE